MIAAIVVVAFSRVRSSQPHHFLPQLAFLSLFVGFTASTHMVVAAFTRLAQSGSGGIGAVSASLFEATALLLPSALASLCIGALALATTPRATGEQPVSLLADAPVASSPVHTDTASWLLLLVSLCLVAIVAVWHQSYLMWILEVIAGRTTVSFERASALIGAQTLAFRLLCPGGALVAVAALFYAWRASQQTSVVTSPSSARVAALGAVLVSLLVSIRALHQLTVFNNSAMSGMLSR